MSVKEKMLEILEGIDIRFKEPLHSYSYTKVGGEADYLVFPRNRFELARVVKFANQEISLGWYLEMPVILSSVMVELTALSSCFDHFRDIKVNGYVIEAEAGAKLIDVTHVARSP